MRVPTQEQMKRFLYGELPEEESQVIEEELFVNNELFYELTNLENDLIDRYLEGRLSGEELKRFERSLDNSAERRAQVKDARALQRHIREHKTRSSPAAVTEAARPRTWERLSRLFSFQHPLIQYAMAGLIVVLGVGAAWLFYDGYRMRQELAQARVAQVQREHDLLDKFAAAERQVESLRQEVKAQGGKNEELNARLQQREEELDRLRRQRGALQDNMLALVVRPTITAINTRGAAGASVVKYGAGSVTVRLLLSTETRYETYEIREQGKTIVSGRARADARSGKTYLVVTLPARDIVFNVWGVDAERGIERVIGEYRLDMQKTR